MNENISWGKIAVLIVAIVGVVGVAFVLGKKNTEQIAVTPVVAPVTKEVAQPVKKETEREIVKNAESKKDILTYTNDLYGFSFEYPKRVGKFRVEMSQFGKKYPHKSISFYFPTTDPRFKEFNSEFKALMLSVLATDQNALLESYCAIESGVDADMYMNDCQWIDMSQLVGKNSKYIFRAKGYFTQDVTMTYPQDGLTDDEFNKMIRSFVTASSK